ncbi:MAG: RidA family protein [Ignavibacteria bacterium]|nr:RidA family protein [Ignavibacteria bacterium]
MKKFVFLFLFFSLIGCSFFKKEIIYTEKAPKPIGPYSQAIKVGAFIFLSGQIGVDPSTNNLEEGVENQFVQIMKNIENILVATNSKLSDIVKVTIYLVDINDFEKLNQLYSRYFTEPYPARETVEVSRLPKNAKIEISIIAVKTRR